MKSIIVSAYLKENLGDDLFLKTLFERYNLVHFYIKDAPIEYQKIFKDYKNVSFLDEEKRSFWSRLNFYISRNISSYWYKKKLNNLYAQSNINKLENVVAFVKIGGSIFIEPNPPIAIHPEIEFYNYWLKNYSNIPLLFLGCNFGPYKSLYFFESYNNIFSKSFDVCFRDYFSYNTFKKYQNVRVAPDVVFASKLQSNKSLINKDNVGISVIDPKNHSFNSSTIIKYYEKIKELILELIKQNKNVFLFSFCPNENDNVVINEIMTLLDKPLRERVTVVSYGGNLDEYLDIYSTMSVVFAGRFHSIILSIYFEQYFIPIVYSDKMENYLNDINFGGIRLYISRFEIEDSLVQNMYNSENKLNSVYVDELKQLSNLQFEKLDNLILK